MKAISTTLGLAGFMFCFALALQHVSVRWRLTPPAAKNVENPSNQPERKDDHSAQKKIAPSPFDGIETHMVDVDQQALDGAQNIKRIEPQR